MSVSLRAFNGIMPQLGQRVFVDPSAVVIGDTHLGDDSSIWPCVSVRGDVHHIRIGNRSNIQDGSVLHVTQKSATNPEGFSLSIGDEVTVGHGVILHGCTIRQRVLIGMGATVMDGAYIDELVMVAAGALVAPGKQLKSGWLYCGAPARPMRELSDAEIAFLRQSADNYVRLKAQYLEATGSTGNL